MPSLLHGQAEARGHRRPGRALPAPLRRAQGQEGLSLPPERRRQLQELGLRALVKTKFGDEAASGARSAHFGGGVAIVVPAQPGTVAAVFADDPMSLGSAIDVADREGASQLYFFSEHNTPALARRAAEFDLPVVVVNPEGEFEGLAPAPPATDAPLPEALLPAAERFARLGLEPVWEHAVLTGEVLGLEVARATAHDSAVEVGDGLDPVVTTDVGVGKHDRETGRLLYPDGPTDDAIINARDVVRAARIDGALPQPANQLVPERWLRAVLLRHPDVVGASDLTSAPPPTRREDLRARGVAPMLGDGVLYVASVGVDPDLVAQAADARLLDGRDRDLAIVVPEGDDHPLTQRLAALLTRPARIVTVPGAWRALVG